MIYVISSEERAIRSEYKVGKHSGDVKSLITRYNTYLVAPIIQFSYLTPDNTGLEKKILKHFDANRVLNGTNKTEWIKLDLFQIISGIMDIITQNPEYRTFYVPSDPIITKKIDGKTVTGRSKTIKKLINESTSDIEYEVTCHKCDEFANMHKSGFMHPTWSYGLSHGIDIKTGRNSGIDCIYVANKRNTLYIWDMIQESFDFPKCPKYKTPNGGFYYFFKHNPNIQSRNKAIIYDSVSLDIDYRSENMAISIINPPSSVSEWIYHPDKYYKTYGEYPILPPEYVMLFSQTHKLNEEFQLIHIEDVEQCLEQSYLEWIEFYLKTNPNGYSSMLKEFRNNYEDERNSITKSNFGYIQISKLNIYMNSTPELKAKTGNARKDAESLWLFHEHIDEEPRRRWFKTIWDDYQKSIKQSKTIKSNKKPVLESEEDYQEPCYTWDEENCLDYINESD